MALWGNTTQFANEIPAKDASNKFVISLYFAYYITPSGSSNHIFDLNAVLVHPLHSNPYPNPRSDRIPHPSDQNSIPPEAFLPPCSGRIDPRTSECLSPDPGKVDQTMTIPASSALPPKTLGRKNIDLWHTRKTSKIDADNYLLRPHDHPPYLPPLLVVHSRNASPARCNLRPPGQPT